MTASFEYERREYVRLPLTVPVNYKYLSHAVTDPAIDHDARGNALAEGADLSTSAVKLQAQNADGGSICRPFTARGLRSGLALNISDLKYAVKKSCPKPKNDNALDRRGIEQAFVGALQATASHALRGSQLELKDVAGNTLMLLEPQADLIGPTWVVEWLGRGKDEVKGDEPLTATFTDAGLVIGSTGVRRNGSANSYIADFALKQATRIDIAEVATLSGVCSGAKQKKKADCKQDKLFMDLLQQVDRYIARDTDLRLYRGTDVVMSLVPQYLIATED